MQNKTLIFIPTYDEAENVERIFRQIRSLGLDADILFLDDNSPDGTGRIIDSLVQQNAGVFVIHRIGKLGVGSAHQTGIAWAYENKYDVLITMDCDFTHSPSYIFNFIQFSNKADIVVGSRYLKKHGLASWNMYRKFLTRLGHFLTVSLLNMPYDASGAFRLYNIRQIDRNIFSRIQSSGYSFFFESLFILHFNAKTIFEIPIELPSRMYGTSKMTFKDVWKSFIFLTRLFYRKSFNKKSLLVK